MTDGASPEELRPWPAAASSSGLICQGRRRGADGAGRRARRVQQDEREKEEV